ncbi:MAG TPA: NADH-quinone oxidoreductase subunit NuoE [Methanomassiliicoccales archaeon]|nr:NADH-quinone oxidoreductase subunit NuoE [Methanomassiliicoccales archaeon]
MIPDRDETARRCGVKPGWELSEAESHKLAKILLKYHKKKEDLISLLQDIQEEFGYLPRNVLHALSKEIHVPEHEIFGVATFYSQFTFNQPGRHKVRVCLGTACHVRGAVGILEELERNINIKPGSTSKDGEFSLETVMCLGACALGPIVVMDDEYHGQMTPLKVQKLVRETRRGAGT